MSSPSPAASPVVDLHFHHVGVAVKSLDRALACYTGLFGMRQVTEALVVPSESVKVCFVEAAEGVLIELVEGIGEKSPVSEIVERNGAGPYHLCYRVDDLDDAIRKLRAGGCHRLKRFERPAQGFRRFAFLLTPDRQLFELCERERNEVAS
jgi:methylmalonyl-CoA/ethylmalonyl-CoA epimerase